MIVICGVRARRGRDIHAQALAEQAGYLGIEGKALRADQQSHGHRDSGQLLVVGQVPLIGPELDTEERVGACLQALLKRCANFVQPSSPGYVAPEALHRGGRPA